MNYAKYEKICMLLKECIDLYEQINTKNYTFFYKLASGDNLNFKIQEVNVSHLLGVNTEVIGNSFLSMRLKHMNSYELLNFLLEDPYRFSRYLMRNKIDLGFVFSPMIEEKIKSFETSIKFSLLPLVGIIKIDKSKKWQDDLPETMDVDYLIIKEFEENYAVLGLRKKENTSYYVPISNMCWKKNEIDKYMKYLKNQECSLPFRLYIKELEKKMWFNESQKKVRLQTLNDWHDKFGMTVSVGFDYEKLLLKSCIKSDENEQICSSIETITTAIKEKKFPIETDYENLALKRLSYAINDFNYKNCSVGSESYSLMKEELENKKVELSSIKERNLALEQENHLQQEELENTRLELNLYKSFFDSLKLSVNAVTEKQMSLTRTFNEEKDK